jgi:hypothetical protein
VKGVKHRSVAEKKCKCLRLDPLGEIEIQFRGCTKNILLYLGVNPVIPIQNPRHGGDAHASGNCNIPKPDSTLLNHFLSHRDQPIQESGISSTPKTIRNVSRKSRQTPLGATDDSLESPYEEQHSCQPSNYAQQRAHPQTDFSSANGLFTE